MAERYSRIGAFPQIILLLLLVAALAFGGVVWFDYLGLIDARDQLAPIMQLVGIQKRSSITVAEDILLLDKIRLEKLQEAVGIRSSELDMRDGELEQRLIELDERSQQLEQQSSEITEREVSLNERLQQYENRRAVLEQNSRDLTSMRPDDAVAILEKYDDQLLIDTLRITEELAQQAGEVSLVSVWMARFDPARTSELQRKMTIKPDETIGR